MHLLCGTSVLCEMPTYSASDRPLAYEVFLYCQDAVPRLPFWHYHRHRWHSFFHTAKREPSLRLLQPQRLGELESTAQVKGCCPLDGQLLWSLPIIFLAMVVNVIKVGCCPLDGQHLWSLSTFLLWLSM